ncbi:TetR family transcriptional regulator [Pseudonocardia sp. MH-G8]|uniref:TetR family transcriptional regulator n=1 Tax=Pseudonocardia sp. MH-G8 TaxID=1854588 RepID=UPI000BA13A8D|nr:TetR family transcriptional regulator [Pseudonocardia sp. MH-G8]OZM82735.1 TetR family transcriptional regulator [Pseudonocardia sp. MH-G8]
MKAARDRRASRWDDHRRTRRAELTDAAVAAIRRHGAGVGMDDVAAAAGTSKTVVYRHFADRTALYLAVCERVAQVLLGQVRAAMDGAAGPRAGAAAAIAAYLRLIEHDPEVYRFVAHRPLVERAPGADPLADLVSLIGDQVADVIAEHLARVGADPEPAVAWGHGVVGMVRAAADNWIARPTGTTKDELADHLTALAWTGLSGVVGRTEEETP